MREMILVLVVGAGGGVGSVLRYLTAMLMLRICGPGFPWATLAVNVVGSFAIGVLGVLASHTNWLSAEWRAAIGVGFLGGLTTFSTFSLETAALWETNAIRAAGYVAANLGLGLLAVASGLALGKWLAG